MPLSASSAADLAPPSPPLPSLPCCPQSPGQELNLLSVYVPTNHVYIGDVFLMEEKVGGGGRDSAGRGWGRAWRTARQGLGGGKVRGGPVPATLVRANMWGGGGGGGLGGSVG